GGPAGLAAARAAAEERPGARVLLVDEQDRPGGSLLAEPGGVPRARATAQETAARGVRLWPHAQAVAYYPEDGGHRAASDGPPGVLAVIPPAGLVRLGARRFVYA